MKIATAQKNLLAETTYVASFFPFFKAAKNQVTRALEAKGDLAAAKRSLGLVSLASLLETYINTRMSQCIRSPYRAAFDQMSVPVKYLCFPKFTDYRNDDEAIRFYVTHHIHQKLREIFDLRNSFVHGSLQKWKGENIDKQKLKRLWNSGIYSIFLLESQGQSFLSKEDTHDLKTLLTTYNI